MVTSVVTHGRSPPPDPVCLKSWLKEIRIIAPIPHLQFEDDTAADQYRHASFRQ